MLTLIWRKWILRLFFLRHISLEALAWLSGLIFLACIDPLASNHWSICPLKNLGFDYCPGCGLGASIHYLLRGDFYMSLQIHPLGLFAFTILISRIIVLTKSYFRKVQFK